MPENAKQKSHLFCGKKLEGAVGTVPIPNYDDVCKEYDHCAECPGVGRPRSVVKEWLTSCTLKQQTVLLSATRGCDNVPKEDVSKKFVRKLRRVVLIDASPLGGSFMKSDLTGIEYNAFLKQPDIYSVHWLFHFLHAVEIVGYKHPDAKLRAWFDKLYTDMCGMLHVNPETAAQCDARLADGVVTECWKV